MRALYKNVAQQCQRDSFIINSGWIPAQDKNSINFKTLPTAQRTLGFSALTKVTFIGLITSSDINLDEKIQLWNLDKGSTSKPQTNISLEILTKLQHTQWTSTSKSRLYLVVEVQKNVSFENLTKLHPWYLTKLRNLYQNVANAFLSISISNRKGCLAVPILQGFFLHYSKQGGGWVNPC